MIAIGLYVMGEKGLACLNEAVAMASEGICNIAFITAARDESVQNDYFEAIKSAALGFPFFERHEFREQVSADMVFAISWRWLIAETGNLYVFHDSLLPKYRGFNPLVTALIEGDPQVGVTAIRANAQFDRGNIVGAAALPVVHPVKIERVISEISVLYKRLLRQVVESSQNGTLAESVQDESAASYSLWRDAGDYRIDWSLDAQRISRMVYAVGYPYNGAFTELDGRKISVWECEAMPEMSIVNRTPGKLISIDKDGATVVCGSGLLKITKATDQEGQPWIFNKLRSRLT